MSVRQEGLALTKEIDEIKAAHKVEKEALSAAFGQMLAEQACHGSLQGWQLIETAPKDGTRVLCWIPARREKSKSYQCVCRWYSPDLAWQTSPYCHDVEPTHWMPLPPPPKVSRGYRFEVEPEVVGDGTIPSSKRITSIGRYFLAQLGQLPKGRLVKLFYLLDWKTALASGKTITGLQWCYNHFGPYLPQVVDMLADSDDIVLHQQNSAMGSEAEYLKLKSTEVSNEELECLSEDERKLADEVIAATKDLNFTDFIKLVYSTYPIRISQKYTELDLPVLAKNYQEDSSE